MKTKKISKKNKEEINNMLDDLEKALDEYIDNLIELAKLHRKSVKRFKDKVLKIAKEFDSLKLKMKKALR